MSQQTRRSSRRRFLAQSAGAALVTPYFSCSRLAAQEQSESQNDRPLVGAIGCGGQGSYIARRAREFGEIVAVCDVDSNRAEAARQKLSGGSAKISRRYQEVLDRKDIDLVTIGTPDHWHSKIAVEAMQAGKDVYCEKPLTLTIEEGQQICKVARETGRIFQVGTQQRSEGPFAKAVAICRAGRIGEIRKITVAIGGAPQGGPFKKEAAPSHLDWDYWQGQTQPADYIRQRSHHDFRWWYEYSGGKMTDWGAHHVDVAHWVLGASDTGPSEISGTASHPVTLKDGYPVADDQFNTATNFQVQCKFPNDVEVVICDKTDGFDNGLLIEGSNGRIFVNRGRLTGKAVEELAENPLPEDAIKQLYGGKQHGHHMRNFFECVKSRDQPVSDVFSHHRAITTCHLANIAIRLGRPLKWDPETEQIQGDEEARQWQRREQRRGFEIVV